jgi:hypothetical protein
LVYFGVKHFMSALLYLLCAVPCSAYQRCDHPDEPTRRTLGAKIGLEARQVQYWFQNQRSQMQVTVTQISF